MFGLQKHEIFYVKLLTQKLNHEIFDPASLLMA